jgi:hypothetical protein
MALTRVDLDVMRCQNPGCECGGTVLHLSGRCHPAKPVTATYNTQTGIVTVLCAKCAKTVTSFVVSTGLADEDWATVAHEFGFESAVGLRTALEVIPAAGQVLAQADEVTQRLQELRTWVTDHPAPRPEEGMAVIERLELLGKLQELIGRQVPHALD